MLILCLKYFKYFKNLINGSSYIFFRICNLNLIDLYEYKLKKINLVYFTKLKIKLKIQRLCNYLSFQKYYQLLQKNTC